MTVLTSGRRARYGQLAGFALLSLVALFAAHDAIYIAQFGIGGRYAVAMSSGGHDGYYVPASLMIAIAATVAGTLTVLRLGRLTIVAAAASARAPRRAFLDVGPTYLGQLRGVWSRLFPVVVLLFSIQENLEAILAGRAAPGTDVLFGSGAGFVLPILTITTFLLAVVAAGIRWRTRILTARLRVRRQFARPVRLHRKPRWTDLADALARDWMIDRRDAGRAPPITA